MRCRLAFDCPDCPGLGTVQFNKIEYQNTLTKFVIGCMIGLVVSILVYGLLRGYAYKKVRKNRERLQCQGLRKSMSSGGWLTKTAR